MRVLHVCCDYGVGGTETIVRHFGLHADMDPRLSHYFFLFRPGALSKALLEAGASVHVQGSVRLRDPIAVWRARRAFARVLREHRIEAVVFHQYSWMPLLFSGLASGLKQVRWFHNAPAEGWTERALPKVRRRFPNVSIFCSEYLKNEVHVRGKAVVLYAPVERPADDASAERRAVRNQLSTTDDSLVIAHVGRMTPIKGQETLLRALGSLQKIPNWNCWIIGGPHGEEQTKYFESLRGMARDIGIQSRVRFTRTRSDARRLLRGADIYCQPNRAPEAFGLTFIEALYAGLPVVTTGFGGAAEIVTQDCGVMLSESSTEQVASALERLLQDRELRTKMHVAAPQRATALCDAETQTRKLGDMLLGLE